MYCTREQWQHGSWAINYLETSSITSLLILGEYYVSKNLSIPSSTIFRTYLFPHTSCWSIISRNVKNTSAYHQICQRLLYSWIRLTTLPNWVLQVCTSRIQEYCLRMCRGWKHGSPCRSVCTGGICLLARADDDISLRSSATKAAPDWRLLVKGTILEHGHNQPTQVGYSERED